MLSLSKHERDRPSTSSGRTVVAVYADRTIAAYRSHARRAIANWNRGRRPSRFLQRFLALLPPGGRVLDYGCGIGRDIAWMRRRGFRPEGVEGALEFVLEVRRRLPGALVRHARFETAPLEQNAFDGVWCSAALIHVPPEELKRQLEKLRACLRPAGVLGLTLAWGGRRGFTQRDWIPGRYVAGYRRPEAVELLREWERLWLKVVSGDGRIGRWIQVVSRRPG